MHALEFYQYVALFLAALVAGFVDSIAGGGGIITIPALMAVGLPPHLVLGTNKTQACFGSAMATWRYAGRGLMEIRKMGLLIACTAVGAAAGTLTIQHISQEILRH
ncbi:MAG: TSUP family transporter, partial [Kiritimatiellaeota bacterium]|nr:TSUP family transporter [Kiritimatiellota bacterium]